MSDGSRGLFIECDEDTRVVSVPYNTIGVAEDRLLGRPFASLALSADFHKALAFVAALRRDGVQFDWPVNVAAGEVGALTLHFSGYHVASGFKIVGSRTSQDLESLLEELSGINNDLANLNRALAGERARALATPPVDMLDHFVLLNNELINAQRELARINAQLTRANAEKARLMGVAAHDLRTPLGVMSGYAEVLQMRLDGRIQPQEMAMLEMIEESSRTMVGLIESMLLVSSADAGRLTLTRVPTDLLALIRRNVEINGILADRKEISVTLELPAALPPQSVDPLKIEQVLNNLIGNAIKFSYPGSAISVSVRNGQRRVEIAVADGGSGIAPDQMDLLFKPFSRTTTRPTAGEPSTGLGLAICKNIIEAHGGTVAATSRFGSGSVFTVTLPFAG